MENFNDVPYLSSEEVSSLKHADQIVITIKNGRSYITVLNLGCSSINIPIGTSLRSYDINYRQENIEASFLEVMEHDRPLFSIIKDLKKDDQVIALWVAENNCNLYMQLDLHMDQLYLIVKRQSKRRYYLLNTAVCLNNSAKFIQKKGL